MSSSLPSSGRGTSNSSRTEAVSPAVHIDVDATPAPAALGQVKYNNIYNVWNYGFSVGQGFKCGFCGTSKKSGGATRLMQHLAGVPGDVAFCQMVTSDVKQAMWTKHKDSKERKKNLKRSKKMLENALVSENGGKGSIYVASDDEEQQMRLVMALSRSDNDLQQEMDMRQASHEHGSGSGSSFAPAASGRSGSRPPTVQPRIDSFVTASSSVQPRIDTTLKEGVVDKLAQAWSKWFHANDIAGIKADCPYYRAAMRLTQEIGTTSRLFSGSDIDGPCLDANYKSIEEALEVFKRDWKRYGVIVMCDSWTGTTNMSIINFMVYCHGRTFFHKAINASEHMQNAEYLYTHIKQVWMTLAPKMLCGLSQTMGQITRKHVPSLLTCTPKLFGSHVLLIQST
ncbi:uncharacterized protein LOC120650884 [Panicum virgatum]|uniref:uncharacterized protein LOC120650884 n=1 Tax=Panicum virgatum TaxID=38727 RepID=UPI0019D51F60|nr:uncharacterized protein LOC120650884 [Panicum virgatum]XP_039784117.1 uncharacterized protein LOC120650884 [Panicum virgatum]